MSQGTVEDRLSTLEREMAELRRRLAVASPPSLGTDWLNAIAGSMKDYPEFDEVLRLGRAVRESDRPEDEEFGDRP